VFPAVIGQGCASVLKAWMLFPAAPAALQGIFIT
jgi:hypothetical protein